MKKFFIAIISLILSATIATSCTKTKAADSNIYQNKVWVYTKSYTAAGHYKVYIIHIEGHDYIMTSNHHGGAGLCHAAHCRCFSENN